MIPKILDDIPEDSVMYLINALAFDAQWDRIYTKDCVHTGTFTNADGSETENEFMYSDEYGYLESAKTSGFIKYYKSNKYAFAALLPGEGVSVNEALDSLDGEALLSMLSAPQSFIVEASIPKFSVDHDIELSSVLSAMGMPDAFDMKLANLSGIGSYSGGNIFINRVLHKTHIDVDEQGTRAGAASAVELATTSPPEIKIVKLNRPFIYMRIDCKTCLPFFIGTVEQL